MTTSERVDRDAIAAYMACVIEQVLALRAELDQHEVDLELVLPYLKSHQKFEGLAREVMMRRLDEMYPDQIRFLRRREIREGLKALGEKSPDAVLAAGHFDGLDEAEVSCIAGELGELTELDGAEGLSKLEMFVTAEAIGRLVRGQRRGEFEEALAQGYYADAAGLIARKVHQDDVRRYRARRNREAAKKQQQQHGLRRVRPDQTRFWPLDR